MLYGTTTQCFVKLLGGPIIVSINKDYILMVGEGLLLRYDKLCVNTEPGALLL